MCAVTLFFAGMGTKLTEPRLRVATIGLGALIFLGSLIWVLTLPVSFAV